MSREWERRDFLKSITLGTTALSLPQSVLGSQQPETKPNSSGGPPRPAGDVYDGKVYGIFDPLKVSETAAAITITGSTFTYAIDRATGQITSVKALDDEFIAPGTSFPNPYVGLMPEDDPGARREGGKDRPRFGYEKSAEIRPLLWSGGLTDADRFDAAKGTDIHTELLRADPEFVEVRARGRYGESPLSWTIDYLVDVDGFTKVTVGLTTAKPVQLRWNCFNHAFLAKKAIQYFTKVSDPGKPPTEVATEPTVSIGNTGEDQPVLESHWNAFFRLANRVTGIEFSKQDFQDRYSGYRDSAVILEDGREVDTGVRRNPRWTEVERVGFPGQERHLHPDLHARSGPRGRRVRHPQRHFPVEPRRRPKARFLGASYPCQAPAQRS